MRTWQHHSGPQRGEGEFAAARRRMVDEQLRGRGIWEPTVLAAMERVPRHLFVSSKNRPLAYADRPVDIGYGQTISQPYVVAYMCQSLGLSPGNRVLEIGAGCGYQAAVLAEMGCEVFTVEIVAELAAAAKDLLKTAGYEDVSVREGDGYAGWPQRAPFAGILMAAAPPGIPEPLLEELAEGGVLIAPVGRWRQNLVRVQRRGSDFHRETLFAVRFVPMTGRCQIVKY